MPILEVSLLASALQSSMMPLSKEKKKEKKALKPLIPFFYFF
jgi:hypothetical protein